MLNLFSAPDRMFTFLKTEALSLHFVWAKFLNPGGFVFNLLCCLKSWKLPWCCVIFASCVELWLHTKCLRWKIDQSWWEEESTGEQTESRWWYSIQFKCILLVLSISHIMLGQARGQFLFSKGFKKQIYCITDGEYKVDSSSIKPSAENSFSFSHCDNGDCSCTHEFKVCCLCMLKN